MCRLKNPTVPALSTEKCSVDTLKALTYFNCIYRVFSVSMASLACDASGLGSIYTSGLETKKVPFSHEKKVCNSVIFTSNVPISQVL